MTKTGDFREGESREDLDMTKIAKINDESELKIISLKLDSSDEPIGNNRSGDMFLGRKLRFGLTK
jgi:hypothetical protein